MDLKSGSPGQCSGCRLLADLRNGVGRLGAAHRHAKEAANFAAWTAVIAAATHFCAAGQCWGGILPGRSGGTVMGHGLRGLVGGSASGPATLTTGPMSLISSVTSWRNSCGALDVRPMVTLVNSRVEMPRSARFGDKGCSKKLTGRVLRACGRQAPDRARRHGLKQSISSGSTGDTQRASLEGVSGRRYNR